LLPSLLVVGAGPLQLAAIHEARALGIRSIAVDGNSSAVGLALCDAPYVADILDPDAVSAIAAAENIDGIMTLCTDAPVCTVAEVGRRMGLTVLSPQAARSFRTMGGAFAAYTSGSVFGGGAGCGGVSRIPGRA
jgi:formate-dependent phosphoribosylglycinamide formyltransferase (GAR transformylase)